MYIGLGLTLKRKLTFTSYLELLNLSRTAQTRHGIIAKISILKNIIRNLCDGSVHWYHIFYINKILKTSGMTPEKKSDTKIENIEQDLYNSIIYISAVLGQTPEIVSSTLSPEHAEQLLDQLEWMACMNKSDMAYAHADPSGFIEEIRQRLNRLSASVASISERIETVEESILFDNFGGKLA